MPLTDKGQKIMANMQQEYGDKKGKSVFYASRNSGKISGVDPQSMRGNNQAGQAVKSGFQSLIARSMRRSK